MDVVRALSLEMLIIRLSGWNSLCFTSSSTIIMGVWRLARSIVDTFSGVVEPILTPPVIAALLIRMLSLLSKWRERLFTIREAQSERVMSAAMPTIFGSELSVELESWKLDL